MLQYALIKHSDHDRHIRPPVLRYLAIGKRSEVHPAQLFNNVLGYAVQHITELIVGSALRELFSYLSAQEVGELRKNTIHHSVKWARVRLPVIDD